MKNTPMEPNMFAEAEPGTFDSGPEGAARSVVEQLQRAGFEAYFAGGCVRDGLLRRAANDFDVATSAEPHQIQLVFPRAQGVGEFFDKKLRII